jgi:hypothetical protein
MPNRLISDAEICMRTTVVSRKELKITPVLMFPKSSIDCEERGMTANVDRVELARHDVMTFVIVIYIIRFLYGIQDLRFA